MKKHVLILNLLIISFQSFVHAQLIPGDVNKPVNQVYMLGAVNFGTKGTPNIYVSTVPNTCSNTLTLNVQWNTNVNPGNTTIRFVEMHGGIDYSGALIPSSGGGNLVSGNGYTRSFTLTPGIYTFGLHLDPFDDIIGNIGSPTTVPGDDVNSVGTLVSWANDQTRCAVFGITVLPTNSNLHTCTISHTNASNCVTPDGSLTISGLNSGTSYDYSFLVNGGWTTQTTSASGTLTIPNLLTGIYPVRVRRNGETCYRQFNIKVGNNTGVDCFADNQLIDASLGVNLINGGDFGVNNVPLAANFANALPRNTANTLGSGTTDYAPFLFTNGDPQDSRYSLTDSTNLRLKGFPANVNDRLRNWQWASGGTPVNAAQNSHLWACMQRTGDHTGSQNQNNGNTPYVAGGHGQMMFVNANYKTDKVLNISGMNLVAGDNYYFSFWAKNMQPFMPRNKNNQQRLDSTYQPILPRLAMAVNDRIYTFADIPANLEPASYTGVDTVLEQAKWQRYNMRFISPVTTAAGNITIYNFQQGGFGNDFAIDDIEFLALSVVGDRVWNDLDKDGVQDATEPGMANVVVSLLDSTSNTVLQTTVSDAFGYYQFANVVANTAPGTNYRVKFTLPASYVFTTKNAATATVDTDSDVNPSGANFGISDVFNLTAGKSRINIDCGLVFDQPLLASSIGNVVWFDANKDGIQNNSESGLANVTVILYNSVGSIVNTTVTDASGFYRFDNITPGNYRVGITQPTGTICAGKDLGGDDNLDSDINTTGVNIRKTDLFAVAANTQLTNIDIGIQIMPTNSSSFGDLCWKDLNANGLQDAGEPGLPNVKIVIINPGADNIQFTADDIRIDSTISDAFGKWQFTNLTGSRYFLVLTAPSGYSYTLKDVGTDDTKDSDINATGVSGNITINNSPYGFNYQFMDIGFTITPPMPTAGSIGNLFWDDINGNGLQEANEFGVPGITVELLDNTSTVIQTTTTDLDGLYKFPYVNPASGYRVRFSNIPPGFQFTLKDQGLNYNIDSDIDLNTGLSNAFTLAANQVMDSIDGGIRQILHTGNSSVGSYIWYDFNNNGIQDIGETGVPNINVILRNPGVDNTMLTADDVTYTTTTNSLGQFMFNGLPQGTYRVEISYINSNFNLTTVDQGTNDNLDSDGNAGPTIGPLSTALTNNFRLLFGEDKLNIGFGLVPNNNVNIIGNRVWKDKNSNGRQDVTGENEGVQGVVIQLLNSTGSALADADAITPGIQPYQTSTDQYGYWSIVGVPDGTYIPRFALLPPGYRVTSHKVGTNTEDSDIIGNGRSSVSVTVGGGSRVYNDIDLGLIPQSAVLGDFVWDDYNGDGIQDAIEPGIGSATAILYNSANVALGSAVTDGAGKYYFPNTPAGTYYLKYSNYPSGMQFTTQETNPYATNGSNVNPVTQKTNNYTIASYGDSLHIDAGLRVLNTANVGNYVWMDTNNNGIQDATEKPFSGAVVKLKNAGLDGVAGNADDFTLGATITDGLGFYQFIITPTGNNYYLDFSNIPSGATFSPQNVGGAGASNNSKVNGTGLTATFNLGYGVSNQIQDAGIINIAILPVIYEYFTAEKATNGVALNWKLGNSNDVNKYDVLYSTNGYHFNKIATVPNNFIATNFNYIHTNPINGNNYYKIATYDAFDNTFYSDIKVVKYDKSNNISIYPNPTTKYLFLSNTAGFSQNNQYQILDANGKKVLQGCLSNVSNKGIDVSNLATGKYVILITENNIVKSQNSFIKN